MAEGNHQFTNPFIEHEGYVPKQDNDDFHNTSELFSSSSESLPSSSLAGQRHQCQEISSKLDSIQIAMDSIIKREKASHQEWKKVVNALVHEEVSRLVPEIMRSQSHQCESSPIHASNNASVPLPPPPKPQHTNPFLPNYVVPVDTHNILPQEVISGNDAMPTMQRISKPQETYLHFPHVPVSRIPPKLSKPVTELPVFDGTGDLSTLKILFEECAVLNQLEGELITSIWLKQCLKGAARDAVLFEKLTSTDHIFQILESRYGSRLLRQKYDNMLDHRKKKPDESMAELANDIRKMVEVVYFDADSKTRVKMSIKHFIKAIPNIHARYELSSCGLTTLEEIVEKASLRDVFYSQFTPLKSLNESSNPSPRISQISATTSDQSQMAPPDNHNNNAVNQHKSQPRRFRCKHCNQNHPSFVCRPCRHCNGLHYDNACDKVVTGSENSTPIPQQSARQ